MVFKLFVRCLAGLLISGCNQPTQTTVHEVRLSKVEDEPPIPPPPPPSPKGLAVVAYLLYKDSTTSTFDLLDEKPEALWNTIIGAGDAEKPSERTKVILTGELGGLHLTIYNGKRKVEDETLPEFNGSYEAILADTGCEDVRIVVKKATQTLYEGTIPFTCGE